MLLNIEVTFLKEQFSFYLPQKPQSETHTALHICHTQILNPGFTLELLEEVVEYTCAYKNTNFVLLHLGWYNNRLRGL